MNFRMLENYCENINKEILFFISLQIEIKFEN